MKKQAMSVMVFLTFILAAGAVAYNFPVVKNWVDEHIIDPLTPDPTSSEDSSSEEPTSETISLADHPTYVLRAVGSEVTITWETTPADADDPTVVVTVDQPLKVDITGTTANSADFECLQSFTDTVTATFRATNGTVTTADDVTATCVFSFFIPLESIELQLFLANEDGYFIEGEDAVNTVDMPVQNDIYYRFAVTLSPSNATYSNYTFSISEPSGSGDAWGICVYIPGGVEADSSNIDQTFAIIGPTAPDCPYLVEVVSEDGVHSDSLLMSFGTHVSMISGVIGDPASPNYIGGVTIADYLSFATPEYCATYHVGDKLTIYIDAMYWVSSSLTITYDPLLFAASLAEPVTGPYVNDVTITSGHVAIAYTSDPQMIAIDFEVIASSGASSTIISLNPDNYTAGTIDLPFMSSQPVTGITVDHTSQTF